MSDQLWNNAEILLLKQRRDFNALWNNVEIMSRFLRRNNVGRSTLQQRTSWLLRPFNIQIQPKFNVISTLRLDVIQRLDNVEMSDGYINFVEVPDNLLFQLLWRKYNFLCFNLHIW